MAMLFSSQEATFIYSLLKIYLCSFSQVFRKSKSVNHRKFSLGNILFALHFRVIAKTLGLGWPFCKWIIILFSKRIIINQQHVLLEKLQLFKSQNNYFLHLALQMKSLINFIRTSNFQSTLKQNLCCPRQEVQFVYPRMN